MLRWLDDDGPSSRLSPSWSRRLSGLSLTDGKCRPEKGGSAPRGRNCYAGLSLNKSDLSEALDRLAPPLIGQMFRPHALPNA
jgi:hypothetical protein